MWSKGWPAPAKVNRFLRITGRRDDGYHLLQTVFQFVDWCDELDFELLDSPVVERAKPLDGVPEDADLCLRAARLLQAQTGARSGTRIHLSKHLPIGGGLGGGSSDAATVLVALNRLWGLDMPVSELAGLGLQLGADVPVFVRGQACWAEGVGERITPIRLVESAAVLLTPPVHVSTAEVFAHTKLNRGSAPLRMAPADELAAQIDAAGNDCLPLVRELSAEVAEALDYLSAATGKAYLSGTGASVFAPVEDADQGQGIVDSAPCPGWAVRFINRSPLLDRLDQESDG